MRALLITIITALQAYGDYCKKRKDSCLLTNAQPGVFWLSVRVQVQGKFKLKVFTSARIF